MVARRTSIPSIPRRRSSSMRRSRQSESTAEIGGIPSLTAVLVITTGVFGAVVARSILNLLRITEPEVRGFALGVASHGIGTARAFQVSEEMGAFAGLGMGLNGVFTAFVVPVLLPVITPWLMR